MAKAKNFQAFARSAVRQTVEAEKPREQRAQLQKMASVMRNVLQAEDLYVHFDKLSGGRFSVVFHDEAKALLGETVRDWLSGRVTDETFGGDDEEAAEDVAFVWCEKFEDEYALVGVAGREVVVEEFAGARTIQGELQQAVRSVKQALKTPHIYLHDIEPSAVGLADDKNVENLPIALWNALDEDEVTRLRPYARVLSAFSRYRRMAAIGVGAMLLLVSTIYLVTTRVVQPWLEARRVAATAQQESLTVDDSPTYIKMYQKHARAPDPALLLATLYRRYAELLNRPFVAQVELVSLDWEDTAANVFKVGLRAPDALSPRAAKELMEVVGEAARNSGYPAETEGARLTLNIPVAAPARSTTLQNATFFYPKEAAAATERARTRIEELGEDLKAIAFVQGTLLDEVANEIFKTQPFSIRLNEIALDVALLHLLASSVENTNANLESLSFRMEQGLVEAGAVNFNSYSRKSATEAIASGL